MASWRPNTVEEIQAWMAGEYRINPSDKEHWEEMKRRILAARPLPKPDVIECPHGIPGH